MLYALMFVAGLLVAMVLTIKFRCPLFGHKPGTGYAGTEGGGYLTLKRGPVDGLNHEHALLFSKCACCGEFFKVGNLHVNPNGKLLEQR